MSETRKQIFIESRKGCAVLLLAILAASAQLFARAQTDRVKAAYQGCSESKRGYICDISGFRRILATSQFIAVKASPRDRVTQSQLRGLITSLGKSIAEDGAPADLTIQIVPADGNGVSFGPSGVDLVTLRVYEGKPETVGKLLWVETYNGQRDIPWPAIVHSAIAQFQATLRKSS